MKLQKVYFFWICPDMNSFEWFQVLLKDLERLLRGAGKQDLLDYNIYLSRGWDKNQVCNWQYRVKSNIKNNFVKNFFLPGYNFNAYNSMVSFNIFSLSNLNN